MFLPSAVVSIDGEPAYNTEGDLPVVAAARGQLGSEAQPHAALCSHVDTHGACCSKVFPFRMVPTIYRSGSVPPDRWPL